MDANELITSKGYPCEDHQVITEDGYILTMQRIPHGRNTNSSTDRKPVVILQHGLLGASTNYLVDLANESLAYILADAGVDVWLGNSRGNNYSRAHIHLKPSQEAFWDWSFDEMARYDLPAVVDYVILNTGEEQITYVGHSQGSMIGFAGFSQNQTLADKIKLFIALAPVAKVGNIKSPIRLLAPFSNQIDYLSKLFGKGEFLPTSKFKKFLAKDVCTHVSGICENFLFIVDGFDIKNMNKSRVPVYLAHNPAGTSAKNMVHFAQGVRTDTFQKYDYGSTAENLKHYGQATPPVYHPENMTTPVAIFRGGADWLADPEDVKWLLTKLKKVVFDKYISYWEHVDFIYGLDAPNICYNVIENFILSKNKSLHHI
ncbi:lysosomal acid lipase/cholesteryl ester hydrolase [Patella vulgata]|uniref:lysosomal acid lipase/cholesteryl ester hydrolase n=1 Tax=Patella vulgata TaxID=6465 RepID=UPI0024A8ABBA|nr:lysosomal acid lipase/cholesteryl ester hydrolase [Patella vulgata]